MGNEKTYQIYKAYVENVQSFNFAEKVTRRRINRAYKAGDLDVALVQTKLYALLYSTYSEARFMKLIFTPFGFTENEIHQILGQERIRDKWVKCLELAFLKFNANKKGSEIPNKKQELMRLIDTYIVDPSILRNKIAHGQFDIVLNRKNENVNLELTESIQNLDFVRIMIWFKANTDIADIIEELIESPDKAHYNNYYTRYQHLSDYLLKTEDWSIDTKLNTPAMKKRIKFIEKEPNQ